MHLRDILSGQLYQEKEGKEETSLPHILYEQLNSHLGNEDVCRLPFDERKQAFRIHYNSDPNEYKNCRAFIINIDALFRLADYYERQFIIQEDKQFAYKQAFCLALIFAYSVYVIADLPHAEKAFKKLQTIYIDKITQQWLQHWHGQCPPSPDNETLLKVRYHPLIDASFEELEKIPDEKAKKTRFLEIIAPFDIAKLAALLNRMVEVRNAHEEHTVFENLQAINEVQIKLLAELKFKKPNLTYEEYMNYYRLLDTNASHFKLFQPRYAADFAKHFPKPTPTRKPRK